MNNVNRSNQETWWLRFAISIRNEYAIEKLEKWFGFRVTQPMPEVWNRGTKIGGNEKIKPKLKARWENGDEGTKKNQN